MKKSLFFLLFLPFVFACEKEKQIPVSKIPSDIKEFVSSHFPDNSISRATKERNESESYEITLSNGIVLEFDKNNKLVDADGHGNRLPDSIIPAKVLQYVQANYPEQFIVAWENTGSLQEVQLNKLQILLFTLQDDFSGLKE